MGFLARAVAERKASDPLAIWAEMLRAGLQSKAGPTVNLENAFRVAAYFAGLRVISQGQAQVPFKLYQETQENNLTKIVPARDHRIYDVITAKPNDWQTSYEFREQLAIHAELGDAYVWKNRTLSGIAELILLDPGRMHVEQKNEFLAPTYVYSGKDGTRVELPAEQIWHVRGPSWNGFAGLQMLSIAREALGLSIALDDSVAGLHQNGVRPSGVYSIEGTLDDKQHDKLAGWMKKQAATPGSPLLLDRGAQWFSTVMKSVDAQHKEMRDQQVQEVCRFLGVSPHMIGFTDKTSTYASAEQFAIQHVVHCLGPRYARIEQSADVNLLTKQERNKGYYFKFNANGLLRGAAKDRADYYSKALGSGGSQGWMSADEVRGLEELNPRGGDADVIPKPMNKKPPEPDPVPA